MTARQLKDLVAPPGVAPESWQSRAPDWLYTSNKPAVGPSDDLTRVLALPRRPVLNFDSDRARALVELITTRYRRERTEQCSCRTIDPDRFKGGVEGCIKVLNKAQAWALYEIGIVQGLQGSISVGYGKTILDLLAPLALADAWVAEHQRKGIEVNRSSYTVLLLVPTGLQKQLAKEYDLLSQHFRVPSLIFHTLPIHKSVQGEPTLHVYPYSKLSRPEATTFFKVLKPHAVIADESHSLGDTSSVRTNRFLTYMGESGAGFANWTGTLTGDGLEDYAHLTAFALKQRSPLPLDPVIVREWASAIDPVKGDDWTAPPGALLDGLIKTGCQVSGEHVYKGFSRRLSESLGFVTVTTPPIDCGIEIYERHINLPATEAGDRVPNTPKEDDRAPGGLWPGIADCLASVRNGVRPDGEELLESFAIARCLRELASGFFYRWIFPRGEPESLIAKWREDRKKYRKEVREQFSSRQEYMDSPYLCQLAAMRHHGDIAKGGIVEIIDDETGEKKTVDTSHLPEWESVYWPAWRDIKDLVKPSTEPVWIDDFLALDSVEWAKEHLGIVWYDHAAFGRRVAQLGKLQIFGGGPEALDRLVRERGDRSIVLSIKAHGTGRDGLQRLFNKQLVANPLSSAKGWEQVIGRIHRIGQLQTSTLTWFYRHTAELRSHVDTALSKALYIEGTLGAAQKLRLGFVMNELPR